MKIYTEVSQELLTPKVNQFIDEYVNKWYKKSLISADLPSVIGELTGYEMIQTDIIEGGYCDGYAKEIALSDGLNEPHKIIFHEIGHAIQLELEMFEKTQNLMSRELQLEWQAEAICWQLYNRCFPDKPLPKRSFNAYFDKESWLWLIDWYGSWRQNDIEKYLN